MGIKISYEGPLLRAVYGENYTEEDVHELLRAQLRMAEKKKPFVMLHDASQGRPLTAKERTFGQEHMKKYGDRYRGYCVGSAVVVQSAVNRGVITALSWVIKFPYPMKSFAHADDAMEWLMSCLKQELRAAE